MISHELDLGVRYIIKSGPGIDLALCFQQEFPATFWIEREDGMRLPDPTISVLIESIGRIPMQRKNAATGSRYAFRSKFALAENVELFGEFETGVCISPEMPMVLSHRSEGWVELRKVSSPEAE